MINVLTLFGILFVGYIVGKGIIFLMEDMWV